MSGIKQPVTQVRLTNVAIVRLRVHGHRYEVACYKNKVMNWRTHIEQDIDEVLQSRHIFINVSKGVLASDETLQADFNTTSADAIARIILDKGEIQVSEKERQSALESKHKDIAVLVSEMCVNPATCRPYPVRVIESGMHSCHYSINPNKSAKSQTAQVIKQLQTVMPIERAQMRCIISTDQQQGKQLKKSLLSLISSIEEEVWNTTTFRLTVLLSPGAYKQVEELLQEYKGKSRPTIEIVDMKVLALSHTDKKEDGTDQDDDEEEEEEQHATYNSDKDEHTHKEHPHKAANTSTTSSTDADLASALQSTHLHSNKSSSSAHPPLAGQLAASVAAAPHKSKKALRRELDSDDIRTVGERRAGLVAGEEAEDEGVIEDAALIRQQQQQQQSKLKRERKQKNKQKHTDTNTKTPTEEEEQQENDPPQRTAAAAMPLPSSHHRTHHHGTLDEDNDEDEEDEAAPKKGKQGKKSRHKGNKAQQNAHNENAEEDVAATNAITQRHREETDAPAVSKSKRKAKRGQNKNAEED